MLRISLKSLVPAAVLSVLLGGCGGDPELISANEDAKQLYERAKTAMDNVRFSLAIQYFQTLEARYPFSAYALQAQLDLTYSYYRFNQTEKAIAEAERFIRFNPTHPNVDYAYYIKGLAHIKRNESIIERWYPRNPASYNQEPMQDAFNDFALLVAKFPDSPYAADARQHMVYLKNKLAEHEIQVANYYLRRKAWVAAANRANYVLRYFPDSVHNGEALEILVRAYRELDLQQPARDALALLKVNFPDHPLLRENAGS